jgi:ElaA protein
MRWRWLRWDELGRDDLYAAIRLRVDVFVVEQDCPYPDLDGNDARAWHLLGEDDRGLAAYLRAFDVGVVYPGKQCLGRVVVRRSARGTGLGRDLMAEAHDRMAAQFGRGDIKISAQAYLQAFYESLGYAVVGEGYLEDGIPHFPMVRVANEGR